MNTKLLQVCEEINYFIHSPHELQNWPSIRFGLETALLDLKNGAQRELFPSAFTLGKASVPINGLIWMGTEESMRKQIREKLNAGFRCIKMKIGAIDFSTELQLLKEIRKEFKENDLCLRVDANGAFQPHDALEKLKRLSDFQLHSIEQPIAAGQWKLMAELCKKSPVPIGLDEELIGISTKMDMDKIIEDIKPAYLILKPSLHGGFNICEKWIELADKNKIGWWITSALESNIGLNAIAQWTFQLGVKTEQGLGTGQLFTNNFDSPLQIKTDRIWYDPKIQWGLNQLDDE
jgi:L-alanine-DL-glutamate epimerase-like enolase superfamily enzyme